MQDNLNAIIWKNKDILFGAFPNFEIPAREFDKSIKAR